jgi:hypothetical protein
VILDEIEKRILNVLDHNPNSEAPPVAILWPDPEFEWSSVVDRLRERFTILTLGNHEPGALVGPGIWIRCALAGVAGVEVEGKPVVYLPGVRRDAFGAGDECEKELSPLFELQFRSKWFVGPRRRDWTVPAFFTDKDRGLGLDISEGHESQQELRNALERFVLLDVSSVAGRVLDAGDFRELIAPDVIKTMLDWISDGSALKERLSEVEWGAFCGASKEKFGLDPSTATPISAAERLGGRDGAWEEVWARFAHAPGAFPGIPARLEQSRPSELLPAHPSSWPQDSEKAESILESELRKVAGEGTANARGKLADLWSAHSERIGWVWTEMDLAPYVRGLEHLVELAEATKDTIGGASVEEVIHAYTEHGWEADQALMMALAQATDSAQRKILAEAAAAVYLPWIDHAAQALQKAIGPEANSQSYVASGPIIPADGTCFLFVDGLRLDLGHRAAEKLAAAGLAVELEIGLAALPTVTPTAKLALAPGGTSVLTAGTGLYAEKAEGGAKADIKVMRGLLEGAGVTVLEATDIGDPGAGSGWSEIGKIDRRGHDEGLDMVDFIDDEVDRIVKRVRALRAAGWERVELVTDHGWLLLPRELPKTELPIAAVEMRKGRCARLKPGASVEVPTVPWFWDPEIRIAVAPGVSCFEAGKRYEHGGVSPQECVVPRIVVTAGAAAEGAAEILEVKWIGMLCRVRFSGVPVGSKVDVRGLAGDPSTSVAEDVRETTSEGKASLIVSDDELEGEAAFVVITGPEGNVHAQRQVKVGMHG